MGFGGSKPSGGGNLFGFSKTKPTGGGNLFGFGGKNSSSKDSLKIMQTTHFTPGGSDYRALRERVKKIGTVNALVKGPDGKMVHEKIKDKELFEQIKRAVKSGTSDAKWQRDVLKNKGFTAVDAKGNRKTYIVAGSKQEIDRRKALGRVFMPDGPSREEVAVDLARQEKSQKRNILFTQIDREKDDMAAQLQSKRFGGMKKSIDIRNADNTKINAANIGAQIAQASVSALAGKNSMAGKNPAQSGFAGTVAKNENEKSPGSIVSPGSHEQAKGISGDPEFRIGINR